jgi:hypothetical protein
MVFNSTFNNISVMSWQSVLLVEDTGENHRPAASHWQTLLHAVCAQGFVTIFFITLLLLKNHNLAQGRNLKCQIFIQHFFKIVLYWCLDLIRHNIGTHLKHNKYIFDIPIPFCHNFYLSATLGTDHLTWRGGYGFLFRSEIFFRTTQELKYYYFLSHKVQIFFPEFNIRLYDKNSESDYYFFPPPKSEIFFSNIGNQNIFLEKNHNPPFKLNGRSLKAIFNRICNCWNILHHVYMSIWGRIPACDLIGRLF